ncbi:MAG: hypothetical protein ACRYGP_30160 [Janthinobacterium lividum]
MNRAPLSPHARASVLIISRRVAEELVARAFDGTEVLPLVDRIALLKLVLAVDVEASRRVGLTTMAKEERGALTETLREMERGLVEGKKPAGETP